MVFMESQRRRAMDRLAELRERRALTLRELAEMSSVAADTINQIELGHRKPRPSTLRKLAKALDVEVRELFEEPTLSGKAEAPPAGQSEATRARKLAEKIELPHSLDSLNIVPLVRNAVLVDHQRSDQTFARAAESGERQTYYGSVVGEFEDRLEKRLGGAFGGFMYSALLNSVRHSLDLEQENAQLKEELAALREQERTHS